MAGVLIRRPWEDIGKTQGRMSREDGGRNWSEASRSQGIPKISGNHQKLREKHGTGSLSEPPEAINPATP